MAPVYNFFADYFFSYLKMGLSQLNVMDSPPIKSLFSSPDLFTILLLIVVLYLSLLLLISTTKMIFRMVINLIKFTFFLCFIGIVAWCYIRGIDGIQEDIKYLTSTGQYADLYDGDFSDKVHKAAQTQLKNFLFPN